MSLTNCRVVVLAVLAGACMLAACDDAPPEKTRSTVEQATPANAVKGVQLSKNMVAAVSAGKVATTVGVHFALGSVPTTGKPLPMEIAIVPHRKFDSVRAHFEGPDGLNVTLGENFGPRTDVDMETLIQHRLELLPAREGVFMMTVSIDTESDEGAVTRIFSIPVIVGPTQSAAAPAEKPKSAPADPATN